jgi:hypothetical protein
MLKVQRLHLHLFIAHTLRYVQELHHRGISAELATAALVSVFGEGGLDLKQHIEELDDERQQHHHHAAHLGKGHRAACMQAGEYLSASGLVGAGRAGRVHLLCVPLFLMPAPALCPLSCCSPRGDAAGARPQAVGAHGAAD